MTDYSCYGHIVGLESDSGGGVYNVRSGPGLTHGVLFTASKGQYHLPVLEVRPDVQKQGREGRVYQWFHLAFQNGRTGWIREDFVALSGDCRLFGYGTISQRATTMSRDTNQSGVLPAPDAEETPEPPSPTPLPSADSERVKRASFLITAAFEGGSYAAYNNYDAGIVSYGLFQFTLSSSSLLAVLQRFWGRSDGRVANALREYEGRIRTRDRTMRDDTRFKALLLKAAEDPLMQQAQQAVATERYWDVVMRGYITPRQLKLPLSYALLFDMGINFGTNHGFVRLAERQLRVEERSVPGTNGITEQELIAHVARLRKESHYRQAARDNLPGLRVRGDFWVNLVNNEDWELAGDEQGNVNVNGRRVQVRNPVS